MATIVFLKMVADLGFYFTFAGFFASLGGASSYIMLPMMLIDSACLAGSYALNKNGRLRFLPLAIMLGGYFLPGAGIADYIVMILPAAYVIWVAVKELYIPEWDRQVDIFSVYWKVFFVFIAIGLLCDQSGILTEMTIPCGIITLACCVMLMRSLRHERQIYCSKKYQLMNLGFVVAVGVVAMFLSSSVFLGSVLAALKVVYKYIIGPIFMAVIYAILVVLKGILWLFSFIKINLKNSEELSDASGIGEMLSNTQDELGETNVIFERVLIAMGIVAVAIVAILIFKYLAKRMGKGPVDTVITDRRYYAEPVSMKEPEPERGTPVQKVRALYKKFLKFSINQGIDIKKCDTSLDVNYKCSTSFNNSDTEELRSIYMEARYNGEATKENVARAKELYSHIKKKTE